MLFDCGRGARTYPRDRNIKAESREVNGHPLTPPAVQSNALRATEVDEPLVVLAFAEERSEAKENQCASRKTLTFSKSVRLSAERGGEVLLRRRVEGVRGLLR